MRALCGHRLVQLPGKNCMKAASALVAGHRPEPELAHAAVQAALATAGLERADNVILFLSRDFSRHPQPAVLAAARGLPFSQWLHSQRAIHRTGLATRPARGSRARFFVAFQACRAGLTHPLLHWPRPATFRVAGRCPTCRPPRCRCGGLVARPDDG